MIVFDEDYYFEIIDEERNEKVFVLIIYDIINNSKRVRLAKLLQGYGFRVQKSAFEAIITKKKYDKLVKELKHFVSKEDSIRIYKLIGKGQVLNLGMKIIHDQEDVIVV